MLSLREELCTHKAVCSSARIAVSPEPQPLRRLGDVERTGIDWLIAKYKQYSLLRERILSDTLSLRSRVSSASEDPNAIYERARRASSSSKPAGGGRSINYVPGVSSPAAGREGLARVAAARGYLNGRGGGKVAPTGKKNTLDIISSQDDIDDAAWGQSGQVRGGWGGGGGWAQLARFIDHS